MSLLIITPSFYFHNYYDVNFWLHLNEFIFSPKPPHLLQGASKNALMIHKTSKESNATTSLFVGMTESRRQRLRVIIFRGAFNMKFGEIAPKTKKSPELGRFLKSGKRGSNSRHSAWEADNTCLI